MSYDVGKPIKGKAIKAMREIEYENIITRLQKIEKAYKALQTQVIDTNKQIDYLIETLRKRNIYYGETN